MVAHAWENLERNSLVVRVTPQRTGPFEILVRSTMALDRAEVGSPASASQKDQQGWEIRRYVISITPGAGVADRAAVPSALGPRILAHPPYPIPFSESFDAPGPELPFFWTTQNEGGEIVDGWIVDPSNNAGGTVGEVVWNWQDVSSGTTRLILPASTPRADRYLGSVSSSYDPWSPSGGVQIKIQTSTNGAVWTDELWSVTLTDEVIGPETTYAYITHNLNSASTFVAFVITGDLRQIASWIIDDVSVTAVSTSFPFTESFNAPGPELPFFWTTQNEGVGIVDGWIVDPSNNAGGTVGEVVWNWQDVSSGTTRLILPGAQHPGPIDTWDQFQADMHPWFPSGGTDRDPDEHERRRLDGRALVGDPDG